MISVGHSQRSDTPFSRGTNCSFTFVNQVKKLVRRFRPWLCVHKMLHKQNCRKILSKEINANIQFSMGSTNPSKVTLGWTIVTVILTSNIICTLFHSGSIQICVHSPTAMAYRPVHIRNGNLSSTDTKMRAMFQRR